MKYIFRRFILIGLTFFLGSNLNSINMIASEHDNEGDNKDFVENKSNYNVLDKDFYILGPGDILNIKFVGVDELSGTFFIMRDGNIQLPLLGTRTISGLTWPL